MSDEVMSHRADYDPDGSGWRKVSDVDAGVVEGKDCQFEGQELLRIALCDFDVAGAERCAVGPEVGCRRGPALRFRSRELRSSLHQVCPRVASVRGR